jgi:DNA-binding transcriptional regulator YiaG
MTYHYTMCGLDYVYLSNGYHSHDTRYGQGVSIKSAETLDRSIAISVLLSHVRLRGQEVRFIRSLLHLSQTELANSLGIKRLTVARWEGAPNTPIPGPADRLLRLIADDRLFDRRLSDAVMALLPEITDDRPSDMVMVYVPHEQEMAPSLFPEESGDGEGWRPTKAA